MTNTPATHHGIISLKTQRCFGRARSSFIEFTFVQRRGVPSLSIDRTLACPRLSADECLRSVPSVPRTVLHDGFRWLFLSSKVLSVEAASPALCFDWLIKPAVGNAAQKYQGSEVLMSISVVQSRGADKVAGNFEITSSLFHILRSHDICLRHSSWEANTKVSAFWHKYIGGTLRNKKGVLFVTACDWQYTDGKGVTWIN